MKRILALLILIICFYTPKAQTITDTAALRTAINTDIVSNASGGITATKLNRILLGNINALSKVGITSFYRRADSVFFVKAGIESFAFIDSTGGSGSGSVASTDSNFYFTSGGTKINAKWWYNVKDYGAIPNDGLSDDVAIQNAINFCHANGGGTVYFPIGVYTLTNAPNRTYVASPGDTLFNNNQIYIPMSRYNIDSNEFRTVRLLGESPSHTESQVLASFPNPMNGAVLNSTYITSVEDIAGYPISVLGALSYGLPSFNYWNYTNVIVEDLAVIVATQNSSGTEVQNRLSGISFEYVATASLRGSVKIRTSSPPENQLDPYSTTFGYIGPTTSAHANAASDRLYSAGFWVGAKLAEHSTFQEVLLHANRYGLEIAPFYKVIITSLIAENNAYLAKMQNGSNLAITSISGEKNSSPGKYWTPIADFTEATSDARATITIQHSTINAGGDAYTPTKIGDSLTVIIFSDQYGTSYQPLNWRQPNVINYNQWYYDSTTNDLKRWDGDSWENFGGGSVGSYANPALSNIVSPAINVSLLPGTTNSIDLGSASKTWAAGYINNTLNITGSSGGGLVFNLGNGTSLGRISSLGSAVPNWMGTFINSSFNGSGWALDNITNEGGFYKLDTRNGGAGQNGIGFWKIPSGAGTHTDESEMMYLNFATGNVNIDNKLYLGPNNVTPTTKLQVAGRLGVEQGVDVASAAGAISLGTDGNTFEITGTAAITLISNTGWINGSEVTLLFTSTATLTDGTTNSGSNIGMELAANTNFVASAGAVVKLVLAEIGGTQRWREVSRSVN